MKNKTLDEIRVQAIKGHEDLLALSVATKG